MNRKKKSGQGMTEYIILIALIAVALIAAVVYFGQRSKTTFAKTGSALGGADGASGAATARATGETPTASPRPPYGTSGGGGGPPGPQGGTPSAAAQGTGGEPARPGVVAGSGGRVTADFASKPVVEDPYQYYDGDAPWAGQSIPDASDSAAVAAFAKQVDHRSGGGIAPSAPAATVMGFPLGSLLLILLVALAGAFVLMVLARKT